MTTAHLPECPTMDFLPFVDEDCDKVPCICDRLRACEQRVRIEEQVWYWRQGVQAARDAVAEVEHIGYYAEEVRDAALAAIDALRNPPSLPPTTGRALKY